MTEAAPHAPLAAPKARRHDGSSLAETHPSVSGDDFTAAAAETLPTKPEDLAADIARIRALRKPMGMFGQKLALPPQPGYHIHWFKDEAGRVEEAKANGWAHVNGSDGLPLKRSLGVGRSGGPLMGYAMKIPEVFWLEDQKARNQIAEDKMRAIKESPFRAQPGTAQASDKGKFYDPHEGSGKGPVHIETASR